MPTGSIGRLRRWIARCRGIGAFWDKVDLVFGPFSTLLTAPSAAVASRYGYAFIEPAGGGPAVFDQKLHNVFFTQPAPVVDSADVFAHYILSLPKSIRPKTAAYPSLDDPFSSPIADRMRAPRSGWRNFLWAHAWRSS